MLSSARQGALRAPRLAATIVPLPAESSRQAQVRAMLPPGGANAGHGRRVYSAAVLLAAAEGSPTTELATDPLSSAADSGSRTKSAPMAGSARLTRKPHAEFAAASQPPEHRSLARDAVVPVDAPLTAGERFARLVKVDPIGALRSLAVMSEYDRETVDYKAVRQLMYSAQSEVKPNVRQAMSHEEATAALRAARAIIFAQPNYARDPHDAYLGRRLKGNMLRWLLRLAINMGCSRFVAETFYERLDAQVRDGKQILDLEGLAIDLAVARQWSVLTTLLPGPSDSLPHEVWTPPMIANVMQANLALERPDAAISLFHQIPHTPTADSLCSLVQANLEIGDIPAAQHAARIAHEANIPYPDIQLSVLNGYRMLGYDSAVEERVRHSMRQLGLPLEAPILNALIRLRLDANDITGAEAIVGEFRVFGRPSGPEPNVQTALLALTISMRNNHNSSLDVQSCINLWNGIVEAGAQINDANVSQLLRTLDSVGLSEEVYEVFEAAIRGGDTRWALPESFKPGIVLANTVLEICLRLQQYDGLVNVGALMREADIEADQRTVRIVLEFASRDMLSSADTLRRLLRQMTKRTNTTPTTDQFNIILNEAVRLGVRYPRAAAKYFGAKQPSDVVSKEIPNELRQMLEGRIARLKTAPHTTGRSLRTRLMFDTLALGDEPPNRAIRSTWQTFVLRGYRPGVKHYLSLMRAYVKVGAIKDAEDVMRLVHEDGIVPTPEMYTTLIDGNGYRNNPAGARWWYDVMSRTPSGPDAASFRAILQAYTFNGQPANAIRIAREDYSRIHVDEQVVESVAHALRKNNNVTGAIFFIEHHARRDLEAGSEFDAQCGPEAPAASGEVEYILTSRLRKALRKMVNYLGKQEVSRMDAPARVAFETAQRMLASDDVARPQRLRRPPRLGPLRCTMIADQIASAARKDNVSLARDSESGQSNPSYTEER